LLLALLLLSLLVVFLAACGDSTSGTQVEFIEFRSRQMPDGTAIVTSVQLSFDDADPIGPFATPNPGEVYGFELAVDAESVRLGVVTSTGGNTGAREIRFLGPE